MYNNKFKEQVMNKINVNKDNVKSFKLSKVHQQIDNYHKILIDNAKEYLESVYNEDEFNELLKYAKKHRWGACSFATLKNCIISLKNDKLLDFIVELQDNLTAMAILNYCNVCKMNDITSTICGNGIFIDLVNGHYSLV